MSVSSNLQALSRSESNLVFAGSCTRSDERIRAQVALDIGRDYFSRDAIAKDKPLVCSRHSGQELWRTKMKEKMTLMYSVENRPGSKRTRRGTRTKVCQLGWQ